MNLGRIILFLLAIIFALLAFLWAADYAAPYLRGSAREKMVWLTGMVILGGLAAGSVWGWYVLR